MKTTKVAVNAPVRVKGMLCDQCGRRSETIKLVKDGDKALQICPDCVIANAPQTKSAKAKKVHVEVVRGNPAVFAKLGEKGQWNKDANSLSDEQLSKVKTVADFNRLAYYTRFFTISKLEDVSLLKQIADSTGNYLKKKVLKRINVLTTPKKMDKKEVAETPKTNGKGKKASKKKSK
jgi:hypothetical protein